MSTTAARVRRHLMLPDATLADPYDAQRRARQGLPPRQWCRACGLPGQPGDARHHSTAVIQAWRERDAARIGEPVDT